MNCTTKQTTRRSSHAPHGACELKNPLLCKNRFDKGHAPRGARKWGRRGTVLSSRRGIKGPINKGQANKKMGGE